MRINLTHRKKLISIIVITIILLLFIGSCNNNDIIDNITEIGSDNMLPLNGYRRLRIPGIVVTKNDTVITYYEARRSTNDWAVIDIMMFRSIDEGKTFSEMMLVDGTTDKKTINNPVMIVGDDNTIHFLYCVEYAVEELGGGVFYSKSIDDGLSFSEPVEISNQTAAMTPNVNVLALGPGHGIQTNNNVLIIPVWYVVGEENADIKSHHIATLSTLYSLDNGLSWQMGDIIPDNLGDANETAIAELSDGRIMANIRVPGKGYRGIAISPNGYSDWSEIELDYNLQDPTCFGSILSMNLENKPYAILFVNCDSKTSRNNLTLRYSTDNGENYQHSIIIRTDKAGYSDIAHDSKGNIYVSYEINGGSSAKVEKITLDSLLESV